MNMSIAACNTADSIRVSEYLNDGGSCHKLVSVAAALRLVLYQMLGEAIVNVPSGKLRVLHQLLEEGHPTATQKSIEVLNRRLLLGSP